MKSTYSIFSSLLTAVMICYCTFSFGQEGGKYAKVLTKADAEYEEGNYVKANKFLNKFKTKIVKKYGAKNEYLPLYYIRRAKFNLAEGLLLDFENSNQQAIGASAAIYGEASD